VVHQVQLFLDGRNSELLEYLKTLMEKASRELRFEEAARLRDQIRSVESILERQRVVSARMENEDVVGLAQEDGQFLIVILFIRKGALFENRNFLIKDKGAHPSEVMEAFLKQYYAKDAFIPGHIFVSEPVEDFLSISEWLSDLSGKRVRIHQPKRGEKLRLTKMAVENAEHHLAQRKSREEGELAMTIQRVLKMERPPLLVEGLDISTFHGDQAVGAVVSFKDGAPDKGGYRNYRIKSKQNSDDYTMMREMICRRLKQGHFPDLFIVDGGKGHLRVVEKAVRAVEGGRLVALAAIAKGDKHGEGDKIYVPGRKNPLALKTGHPALNYFMRIRDEAHRRAVSYHRKLRGKALKDSKLDRVPGIGEKRKKALLGRFGSLEGLKKSTLEEIAATPEISSALARRIADTFGIT
jgi:excinuclease ABC subunit C